MNHRIRSAKATVKKLKEDVDYYMGDGKVGHKYYRDRLHTLLVGLEVILSDIQMQLDDTDRRR